MGMAKRPRARQATPTAAVQPLATAPRPAPDFGIVGVGASAGGFEAFAQLLEGLPREPNLAIIFVQHLAPNHASALASLLAGHTPLAVLEATEGVRVSPNRVYVVPPNAQMELIDGHLHLGRRPADRCQYNPIDFFFRSLARALGPHAIGVVLSGTASDGALGGLRNQDDGRHYVRAGSGDGQIRWHAACRHRHTDGRCGCVAVRDRDTSPSGPTHRHLVHKVEPRPGTVHRRRQLRRIFRLLLPACGVNFAHYKTPTIIRRLFRRMALLRMLDVDAYIAFLEATPVEVVNLHNDMLIHVTRFFREPESFDFIARDVLPTIDPDEDKSLRMWVAGCATGEEVYSLGMVVHEVLGDRLDRMHVQIFGTDVSESAVAFARQGLYAGSISEDVSADRLRRFFVRTDGGYQVSKGIRDMCVFARQDLTRDPPFSHLDLICCRNVLIYMDTPLQRRLLSMFHYALKPEASLVLGHAESIGYHSDLFAVVNKKDKVYRKRAGITKAPHMEVFRSPIKLESVAPGAAAGSHRNPSCPRRREPPHHAEVRAAQRAARSAVQRRAVQRPDRSVSGAVAG